MSDRWICSVGVSAAHVLLKGSWVKKRPEAWSQLKRGAEEPTAGHDHTMIMGAGRSVVAVNPRRRLGFALAVATGKGSSSPTVPITAPSADW